MIQNVMLGVLLVVILGLLLLVLKRLAVIKHQTENTGQDELGSAIDNMLTTRLESSTQTLVSTLGTS